MSRPVEPKQMFLDILIGLIQVKEEGWTLGKSLGAAQPARGKPRPSRLFYLNLFSMVVRFKNRFCFLSSPIISGEGKIVPPPLSALQSTISEKNKKNWKNCNFWPFWPFLTVLVSFSWFFHKRYFAESWGFLRCIQGIKNLLLNYQNQQSNNFSDFSP